VIVDPVSNLHAAGNQEDSTNMLIRLIDFLRKHHITALLASLTGGGGSLEGTNEGLSSLVDTWLLLRDTETNGERNRLIYVLKSRGMPHSNQVREFLITSRGIKLVEPYLGAEGVMTGSARVNQEARERAEHEIAAEELKRNELSWAHQRKKIETQIEVLKAELRKEEATFKSQVDIGLLKNRQGEQRRVEMGRHRHLTPRAASEK